MELHPRLYAVNVGDKSATIALDEFTSPSNEVTHAWWYLHRNEYGQVSFTVRPEFCGPFLDGTSDTVAEALHRMVAFTSAQYGPVVVEEGYLFGLEFI